MKLLDKTDTIVIILSLIGFMGYNIKDILVYKDLVHKPSGGKVDSYEYSEKEQTYIYHTNRGTTLDSRYFFNKNENPHINDGDYLMKYPHSMELYILKLDNNGQLTPKPKIIGSFK